MTAGTGYRARAGGEPGGMHATTMPAAASAATTAAAAAAAAATTAAAAAAAPRAVVRRPGAPPPRRFFPWPWVDRTGRFSSLKAGVLALSLLPGAWVAWRLATGDYGAEPFKEATREVGLWTIRLLLLALAVTPLRDAFGWQRIPLVRRMLGLVTLGYATAHLLLYAAHMNGDVVKVASEIALRFYLTIGFVALLGLAVLGWTSTDAWMRRLRGRWKRLHRLVFPVALLGALHFFIQSKADVTEPTLVAGLLLWLLAWRALPAAWRASPLALLGVAAAAALGTAAVEYAWYALATGIPPGRVLAANLDVAFGPRPAVWVGIAGVGFAAGALLRAGVARLSRPARA